MMAWSLQAETPSTPNRLPIDTGLVDVRQRAAAEKELQAAPPRLARSQVVRACRVRACQQVRVIRAWGAYIWEGKVVRHCLEFSGILGSAEIIRGRGLS